MVFRSQSTAEDKSIDRLVGLEFDGSQGFGGREGREGGENRRKPLARSKYGVGSSWSTPMRLTVGNIWHVKVWLLILVTILLQPSVG